MSNQQIHPEIGPTSFGKVLRFALKKKALMQKDFAKIIKVKPVQISHWVNQTAVPKMETVTKLFYSLEGFYITTPDSNVDGRNHEAFFGFILPVPDLLEMYEQENDLDVLTKHMLQITEDFELVFPKVKAKPYTKSPTQSHNTDRLQRLTDLAREYMYLEEELVSLDRLGISPNMVSLNTKLRVVADIRSRLMDIINLEKHGLGQTE